MMKITRRAVSIIVIDILSRRCFDCCLIVQDMSFYLEKSLHRCMICMMYDVRPSKIPGSSHHCLDPTTLLFKLKLCNIDRIYVSIYIALEKLLKQSVDMIFIISIVSCQENLCRKFVVLDTFCYFMYLQE